VGKWHAKTGDFVKADQVIAEIETDKVNVEVRSPQDGVISKVFAGEGDEVSVANPFFALTPADGSAAPAAAPAAAAAPVVKAEVKKEEVKAAPAAAPAPKKETAAPKEEKKAKPAESAAPVFTGDRSETRVKMTRMRTRIAARLKESQNTAAMLTTFQECDMSNLIDLRNKFKDDFEKVHGVKLGFMSAFVKAASAALQEIPAVNAVIDDETQEVVYRNYVDISVAVASPNGLVVPVLRNTEKMNFADVEKTIALYGKKAKENKLAIEDMAGGTFTISNGGVFGSLFGTPIINPPQSAILGMHATKLRPVVVNGKVEARPMMYLALTYDHRLIDGREAVTFLKSIAQKIEDPSKLLLTL
jgi:2-oxoglutarate dehydrogenase E2 component (dihydrolipoamide succinyltransferase)